MKPEIAEIWVQALESGEYEQGTGQLVIVTDDRLPLPRKYCCLGVLCDLANKAGVKASGDDPETKRYGWDFATDGATLPEVVLEWADIKTAGGFFGPDHLGSLLVHNDNGDSFPEIAAIIRAHVEDL